MERAEREWFVWSGCRQAMGGGKERFVVVDYSCDSVSLASFMPACRSLDKIDMWSHQNISRLFF